MSSSDVGHSADNKTALDQFEELALEEAAQAPTKRQVERVERRSSRRSQIAVALSLLIAIGAVIFSTINSVQIAQTEAKSAITQEGLDNLRDINKDLRDRGLPQIPEPKAGDPVDMNALAAAAAAIVNDRVKDDPRFRGPQGRQGEPCAPQVPGCTGPPGPGGQEGSQGQQGPPGAQGPGPSDAQVQDGVSAYCAANPVNCIGPKGDPGVPGPQGERGPAIQSFTYQDALGVSYTCTDPDGDLNYTCSPSMGG
jgi:hypothetical protein